MQELIHRAWLKLENKMVYPAQKNCEEPLMSYWIDNISDDHVVMRYIGKKDINSTPIFEGDIVQCDFRGTGVIQFHNSCFVLNCASSWQYAGRLIQPRVIGNVFESPDLIPAALKDEGGNVIDIWKSSHA